MTDLMAIIQNGNGNIKLEVTGEDLLMFSNDVCDTTLWHWAKKNYLKPVKVGNKVRYRQSDIQKILGERNPSI